MGLQQLRHGGTSAQRQVAGRKTAEPLGHFEWYVPYQPGTLSVRAAKDGKVVCTQEIKTAGDPARIKLAADRTSLAADGCDLSFITVSIHDRDEYPVPVTTNEISLTVQGQGKLVGLCSGDPASHENPKAGHMKAFSGLLLAIVQSDRKSGSITVRAASPGLAADTIHLRTHPANGYAR